MLSLSPWPSPMVSVAFERLEKVMFRCQPIPAGAHEEWGGPGGDNDGLALGGVGCGAE
jgi:hypothetical protein